MELLANLSLGFGVAFAPLNLLCALVGCVLGMLVGVLPGIGPVAAMAMLLPAAYALPPVTALILLVGLYCGAQVGGTTAARLGAFFAVCIGMLMLAAFAPMLSAWALQFGPTETFALLVLGLMGAVVLASGSLFKAVGMVLLGMLLGLVGAHVPSGEARFAFGIPELGDGIGLIAIAMGVFGYGEIIRNLAQPAQPAEVRQVLPAQRQSVWPDRQNFKAMTPAVLRGTALGALLALGIASTAAMALVLGTMTFHNIQPGPQVLYSHPALFWGLIATLWIGNLMLHVLNLPRVGQWVRLISVPYRWLFPAIVLICALGAYSTSLSRLDIWLVAAFGFMGYVFTKLGLQPAPLLLGFVLGPPMEDNLRRALRSAGGDWSVFVTQPLSAGFLVAALCLVFVVLLPIVQSRRAEASG